MPSIDKKHLISGALVAVAAILALMLTWHALIGGQVTLRHEAYANQATAIRAVFCPTLVQDYVSRFTPGAVGAIQGLSKLNTAYKRLGNYDWLEFLPLEFTFLFAQSAPEALDATLFVQEHPDGPGFARVLNQSDFFRFLTAFTWSPPALRSDTEGFLVAQGQVPLPARVQEFVHVQWPGFTPPLTTTPRGDVFFELVAGNANGAMEELHGALEAAHPHANGLAALTALHGLWPVLSQLRFTADLVEDDHIAMIAQVTLIPQATAQQRNDAERAVVEAAQAMAAHLQARHGFSLACDTHQEGQDIQAELHLRGFQRLLERALGR